MTSASAKKRKSPSGPPFTDDGEGNKYIDGIVYNFSWGSDVTQVQEQLAYISGIDTTYDVIANPNPVSDSVNTWISDETAVCHSHVRIEDDPIEVQGVTYYPVILGMCLTNADGPLDVAVTVDLMFFKKGELVTFIVPP